MKRHSGFFIAGLFIGLLILTLPGPASARQSLTINGEDGQPLFYFDIANAGQVYGEAKFGTNGKTSDWTLNQNQLNSLRYGAAYWSALLGPLPVNTSPVRVSVGTYSFTNADAISLNSLTTPGLTELADGILNNHQPTDGAAAQIRIGSFTSNPYDGYFGPLTVLPQNGNYWHLGAVITHEMAHAMGMSASVYGNILTSNFAFGPADDFSNWSGHLYDSYGNQAAADMEIAIGGGSAPTKFVIRDDIADTYNYGYVFFQGPETLSVLNGAVLGGIHNPGDITGVPINTVEFMGGLFPFPELSHVELLNSMMSHQGYRNYGGFMEAELAMFQDIGVDIDRKNFFGTSIYTDGGTETITAGYYGRSGGAYVAGTYNDSPLGVGLHIYGSNNTVVMNADALSTGVGAAGIRVDGVGNDLTIAQGRKIHANGEYGTGLMVAYGKDHTVVSRGDIQATGKDGVAARFDFGSNILGNVEEYRGSYIKTDHNGANVALEDELEGSLVKSFDVTGQLHGQKAAIYVSENALVDEINIMKGANLIGDIVSQWNPDDARVQYSGPDDLRTDLTFGFTPDANGIATAAPDSTFDLTYRGSITGAKAFDVDFAGGTMHYNGQMDVHSYTQELGASLMAAINASPTVTIKAQDIDLQNGSQAGVWVDPEAPFQYGAARPSQHAVLVLDAENSLNNQSQALDSSGRYSLGLYDYEYYDPFWGPRNGNEQALMVNSRRSANTVRTGVSAVTAPLAMARQNPASDLVRNHTGEVFAREWGRRYVPGEPDYRQAPDEADDRRTLQSYAPAPPAGDGGYGAGETYGGHAFAPGSDRLWFTPSYNYTDSQIGQGYDIKTPSVALGADVAVTNNAFLGAAAVWAAPDYGSRDADVDGQSLTGLIYGGVWLPEDVELGLFGAYGQADYDQTRRVNGEHYSSNYSATNYGGGISLARAFLLDAQLALRPFVSYEYQHVDVDEYREKPGVYSLSVGGGDNDLSLVQAGTELRRTFTGGFVNGRVYYAGLYGDRRAEAPVFLTGDPGQNIHLTQGLALDRHSLGLAAGAGRRLTDAVELSGDAGFLGGQHTQDYQLSLNLKGYFQ